LALNSHYDEQIKSVGCVQKPGCRAVLACLLFGWAAPLAAAEQVIRCFPVGEIYAYRWKLLELALARGGGAYRLVPLTDDITQARSFTLLRSGALDVVALGTNAEREAGALPVKIDILKGIVGYRVFLIRGADQARIARMDDAAMRRELAFGLQRGWADLPVEVAAGFAVETAAHYENLFKMLVAGRFDAFPRGLNEAYRDLAAYGKTYPQLALERTRALYFPYPVYFWVSRDRPALARVIERGLKLALADGSFRRLFRSCYAREIALMSKSRRHVLVLDNPFLPAGTSNPDTSWWWVH
jgi:hypothetical protein